MSYEEAEAVLASEEIWELATYLVRSDGLSQEDYSHAVQAIERLLLFVIRYRLQLAAPDGGSREWRLYTTAEVAELLTRRNRPVKVRTIQDWIRQGRLEAGWDRTTKGRGVCRLIGPRSVEALLSDRLPPAGKFKNPPVDDQKPDHLDMLLKKDGSN